MDYAHSHEQAAEFAGSAMMMMEERQIPANPNNYTVWYNYFSGAFPDLKQAVDILLDSDAGFTEAHNVAFYRKFCASPYEAIPVPLIAEKMEIELTTVLATLERAGRDAADYGKSLETASGQLSGEQRADELKQLVGRILAQTRAMSEQSRAVEHQLRDSSQQIAQLKEQLDVARAEAMTDALTALANRKLFDATLRQATMESMETGQPLCLLLLDIDHFKKFNDSFGHHIGDQVLKLLASVLRESIKGQDTAARYGGEEFAVILPNTALDGAVTVAEGIRRRIFGKELIDRKSGDRLGRITVSIGVARYAPGEPLRELIERADRAMYAAKHGGRNRVVQQQREMERELTVGA
ncbi:MAG: diguanylate cyclase [Rhodospirillales bacterium]